MPFWQQAGTDRQFSASVKVKRGWWELWQCRLCIVHIILTLVVWQVDATMRHGVIPIPLALCVNAASSLGSMFLFAISPSFASAGVALKKCY